MIFIGPFTFALEGKEQGVALRMAMGKVAKALEDCLQLGLWIGYRASIHRNRCGMHRRKELLDRHQIDRLQQINHDCSGGIW